MRNVEGGFRPVRAVGSLYDKPKGHTPTPRREGGIRRELEHLAMEGTKRGGRMEGGSGKAE